jgi:hypothetical protein
VSVLPVLLRRALLVVLLLVGPASAQAQFAKRAAQAAFCAGLGYAGFKVGEKIAQYETKRMGLAGTEARKVTRQLQIGTAAVLCLVGASLAGTVYEKMSKRDMEARKKEIESAVAEADPVSRDYVLPESKRGGTIVTQPEYQDGAKTCKIVVDNVADVAAGEQATAKYCKNNKGEWELEFM